MPRPKKETVEQQENIINSIEHTPKSELEDMELDSYEAYLAYNEQARALNKKYRMCRYPIKPCPEELHPTQRVIFHRNDQPTNPLPVYLRNHLIEFKKTLVPGQTYDLPLCVIEYLQDKGTPVWKWFDNPDGSKETKISHRDPRFAFRSVFN